MVSGRSRKKKVPSPLVIRRRQMLLVHPQTRWLSFRISRPPGWRRAAAYCLQRGCPNCLDALENWLRSPPSGRRRDQIQEAPCFMPPSRKPLQLCRQCRSWMAWIFGAIPRSVPLQ
ncbi:unnamed protein product, partial [Symbiodinium pilosum]